MHALGFNFGCSDCWINLKKTLLIHLFVYFAFELWKLNNKRSGKVKFCRGGQFSIFCTFNGVAEAHATLARRIILRSGFRRIIPHIHGMMCVIWELFKVKQRSTFVAWNKCCTVMKSSIFWYLWHYLDKFILNLQLSSV